MRNEAPTDWLRIENLAALDALVGRYIMAETPEVHWEDSYAQMCFDSVAEGLEALQDPFYQQHIPMELRAATVLQEVRVFSRYSSELELAWQVVGKVATPRQPLRIWRDRAQWCAAFGEGVPSSGRTAQIAVCLAALRAKGLEVLLTEQESD